MSKKSKPLRRSALEALIPVAVIPLLILLVPVILAGYLLLTVFLNVTAWLVWNTRGIELLYVYSNSPHWKEYIEQNTLPRLPSRAIILNWSERKKWRPSLATLAFRHFGGYREFNPMALIFRPFRRVKKFRFFNPFRDFKHGKPDALRKMEAEFFAALNRESNSE